MNIDRIIKENINKYILSETINNEDYLLYHGSSTDALCYLLDNDMLTSKEWDDYQCICFTREKRYQILEKGNAFMIALHPSALKMYRNIKLLPFNAFSDTEYDSDENEVGDYGFRTGVMDEFEERAVSKNGGSFDLRQISRAIDFLALNMSEYDIELENILSKRINHLNRDFASKIRLYYNRKDFQELNGNYMTFDDYENIY